MYNTCINTIKSVLIAPILLLPPMCAAMAFPGDSLELLTVLKIPPSIFPLSMAPLHSQLNNKIN